MRFQVPQNLDIKDTLFFGLGFKESIFIGGAIGFTIFVYLFLGGGLVAFLLGGPVVGFALLLSFFKYNNQSFIIFLHSIIRFFTRNRIYIWEKKSDKKYIRRESLKETPEKDLKNINKNNNRFVELTSNLTFDESESGSDPDVVI